MSTPAVVPSCEETCDINVADKTVHEVKQKKKKVKESFLRDLPLNASDHEKFQIMCHKYQDLLAEQKDTANKLKQYENHIQSVHQERDQLQTERNRLVLQKDKLETLCRELQKQNKLVQEESLARARAEDEKRREVSDHFQTCISSIQSQLNEYQTVNTDLRKENQEMADKLEQFIKQHDQRETHVEKVIRTRELEVKLAEAKLNKMQCQLDQERIQSQQTVLRMQEESKLMHERLEAHSALESRLKEQIEFYKTKYQNFNKTIAKTNKLFDSAKTEMEKLSNCVKQSERDVVEWRGKWELSQRTLLEVVAEHKKQCEETATARKQADRLGNLCRALRAQLTELTTGEVAATANACGDVCVISEPPDCTVNGVTSCVSELADHVGGIPTPQQIAEPLSRVSELSDSQLPNEQGDGPAEEPAVQETSTEDDGGENVTFEHHDTESDVKDSVPHRDEVHSHSSDPQQDSNQSTSVVAQEPSTSPED